ncbi:MAG: hypothetical protein LIO77_05260 [Rikenellaceae bacterium]|nr:hypothetical protein [Rikenellaceae bacterium]
MFASMSGSGSAVFGIFQGREVFPQLKSMFPDCFVYHEVMA